jgi:hypothetical protein
MRGCSQRPIFRDQTYELWAKAKSDGLDTVSDRLVKTTRLHNVDNLCRGHFPGPALPCFLVALVAFRVFVQRCVLFCPCLVVELFQ